MGPSGEQRRGLRRDLGGIRREQHVPDPRVQSLRRVAAAQRPGRNGHRQSGRLVHAPDHVQPDVRAVLPGLFAHAANAGRLHDRAALRRRQRETAEQCDDGNLDSGDACNSICEVDTDGDSIADAEEVQRRRSEHAASRHRRRQRARLSGSSTPTATPSATTTRPATRMSQPPPWTPTATAPLTIATWTATATASPTATKPAMPMPQRRPSIPTATGPRISATWTATTTPSLMPPTTAGSRPTLDQSEVDGDGIGDAGDDAGGDTTSGGGCCDTGGGPDDLVLAFLVGLLCLLPRRRSANRGC